MIVQALNRCQIRRFSALATVWLLVASLAIQTSMLPACLAGIASEFEQTAEDADPSEDSGEWESGDLWQAAPLRVRRLDRHISTIPAVQRRRRAHAHQSPRALRFADLLGRNGSGGPLRC